MMQRSSSYRFLSNSSSRKTKSDYQTRTSSSNREVPENIVYVSRFNKNFLPIVQSEDDIPCKNDRSLCPHCLLDDSLTPVRSPLEARALYERLSDRAILSGWLYALHDSGQWVTRFAILTSTALYLAILPQSSTLSLLGIPQSGTSLHSTSYGDYIGCDTPFVHQHLVFHNDASVSSASVDGDFELYAENILITLRSNSEAEAASWLLHIQGAISAQRQRHSGRMDTCAPLLGDNAILEIAEAHEGFASTIHSSQSSWIATAPVPALTRILASTAAREMLKQFLEVVAPDRVPLLHAWESLALFERMHDLCIDVVDEPQSSNEASRRCHARSVLVRSGTVRAHARAVLARFLYPFSPEALPLSPEAFRAPSDTLRICGIAVESGAISSVGIGAAGLSEVNSPSRRGKVTRMTSPLTNSFRVWSPQGEQAGRASDSMETQGAGAVPPRDTFVLARREIEDLIEGYILRLFLRERVLSGLAFRASIDTGARSAFFAAASRANSSSSFNVPNSGSTQSSTPASSANQTPSGSGGSVTVVGGARSVGRSRGLSLAEVSVAESVSAATTQPGGPFDGATAISRSRASSFGPADDSKAVGRSQFGLRKASFFSGGLVSNPSDPSSSSLAGVGRSGRTRERTLSSNFLEAGLTDFHTPPNPYLYSGSAANVPAISLGAYNGRDSLYVNSVNFSSHLQQQLQSSQPHARRSSTGGSFSQSGARKASDPYAFLDSLNYATFNSSGYPGSLGLATGVSGSFSSHQQSPSPGNSFSYPLGMADHGISFSASSVPPLPSAADQPLSGGFLALSDAAVQYLLTTAAQYCPVGGPSHRPTADPGNSQAGAQGGLYSGVGGTTAATKPAGSVVGDDHMFAGASHNEAAVQAELELALAAPLSSLLAARDFSSAAETLLPFFASLEGGWRSQSRDLLADYARTLREAGSLAPALPAVSPQPPKPGMECPDWGYFISPRVLAKIYCSRGLTEDLAPPVASFIRALASEDEDTLSELSVNSLQNGIFGRSAVAAESSSNYNTGSGGSRPGLQRLVQLALEAGAISAPASATEADLERHLLGFIGAQLHGLFELAWPSQAPLLGSGVTSAPPQSQQMGPSGAISRGQEKGRLGMGMGLGGSSPFSQSSMRRRHQEALTDALLVSEEFLRAVQDLRVRPLIDSSPEVTSLSKPLSGEDVDSEDLEGVIGLADDLDPRMTKEVDSFFNLDFDADVDLLFEDKRALGEYLRLPEYVETVVVERPSSSNSDVEKSLRVRRDIRHSRAGKFREFSLECDGGENSSDNEKREALPGPLRPLDARSLQASSYRLPMGLLAELPLLYSSRVSRRLFQPGASQGHLLGLSINGSFLDSVGGGTIGFSPFGGQRGSRQDKLIGSLSSTLSNTLGNTLGSLSRKGILSMSISSPRSAASSTTAAVTVPSASAGVASSQDDFVDSLTDSVVTTESLLRGEQEEDDKDKSLRTSLNLNLSGVEEGESRLGAEAPRSNFVSVVYTNYQGVFLDPASCPGVTGVLGGSAALNAQLALSNAPYSSVSPAAPLLPTPFAAGTYPWRVPPAGPLTHFCSGPAFVEDYPVPVVAQEVVKLDVDILDSVWVDIVPSSSLPPSSSSFQSSTASSSGKITAENEKPQAEGLRVEISVTDVTPGRPRVEESGVFQVERGARALLHSVVTHSSTYPGGPNNSEASAPTPFEALLRVHADGALFFVPLRPGVRSSDIRLNEDMSLSFRVRGLLETRLLVPLPSRNADPPDSSLDEMEDSLRVADFEYLKESELDALSHCEDSGSVDVPSSHGGWTTAAGGSSGNLLTALGFAGVGWRLCRGGPPPPRNMAFGALFLPQLAPPRQSSSPKHPKHAIELILPLPHAPRLQLLAPSPARSAALLSDLLRLGEALRSRLRPVVTSSPGSQALSPPSPSISSPSLSSPALRGGGDSESSSLPKSLGDEEELLDLGAQLETQHAVSRAPPKDVLLPVGETPNQRVRLRVRSFASDIFAQGAASAQTPQDSAHFFPLEPLPSARAFQQQLESKTTVQIDVMSGLVSKRGRLRTAFQNRRATISLLISFPQPNTASSGGGGDGPFEEHEGTGMSLFNGIGGIGVFPQPKSRSEFAAAVDEVLQRQLAPPAARHEKIPISALMQLSVLVPSLGARARGIARLLSLLPADAVCNVCLNYGSEGVLKGTISLWENGQPLVLAVSPESGLNAAAAPQLLSFMLSPGPSSRFDPIRSYAAESPSSLQTLSVSSLDANMSCEQDTLLDADLPKGGTKMKTKFSFWKKDSSMPGSPDSVKSVKTAQDKQLPPTLPPKDNMTKSSGLLKLKRGDSGIAPASQSPTYKFSLLMSDRTWHLACSDEFSAWNWLNALGVFVQSREVVLPRVLSSVLMPKGVKRDDEVPVFTAKTQLVSSIMVLNSN